MIYKIIVRLLIIFLILLNANFSIANEKINYIDVDYIINNSLAGKSIAKKLNKDYQLNIKNLKKKEDDLKIEEKKLIDQKNILDKIEFQKRKNSFREKVKNYSDLRNKNIKELNQKKIKGQALLINELTPLLTEYAKEKSISFIIPKKSIIIGKSELDITKDILKMLDKKVKTIKIN